MATRENPNNISRPVWLMKDAVSVAAGGSTSGQIPCDGFDWAYIEVNSDKAYGIYATGNSGFGDSTLYFLYDDGGTRIARTGVFAGAAYGMSVPCRNLAKVGFVVTNDDGVNPATITVRMSLAQE